MYKISMRSSFQKLFSRHAALRDAAIVSGTLATLLGLPAGLRGCAETQMDTPSGQRRDTHGVSGEDQLLRLNRELDALKELGKTVYTTLEDRDGKLEYLFFEKEAEVARSIMFSHGISEQDARAAIQAFLETPDVDVEGLYRNYFDRLALGNNRLHACQDDIQNGRYMDAHADKMSTLFNCINGRKAEEEAMAKTLQPLSMLGLLALGGMGLLLHKKREIAPGKTWHACSTGAEAVNKNGTTRYICA